jgi:hypothetical protein
LSSLNERVTLAASAGTSQATMIDQRHFGFPEWDVFKEKAAQSGLRCQRRELTTNPQLKGRLTFLPDTGYLRYGN